MKRRCCGMWQDVGTRRVDHYVTARPQRHHILAWRIRDCQTSNSFIRIFPISIKRKLKKKKKNWTNVLCHVQTFPTYHYENITLVTLVSPKNSEFCHALPVYYTLRLFFNTLGLSVIWVMEMTRKENMNENICLWKWQLASGRHFCSLSITWIVNSHAQCLL